MKTGPIPVSISDRTTCPPSCPFYSRGCYADAGPLRLHWAAISAGKRGTDFGTFLARVAALPAGQLWRHNQAGDLPGAGDAIDGQALDQLAAANSGKRGFTYTHKPCIGDGLAAENRQAVARANAAGLTINLSANNLAHADQLADLECAPVVVVVPGDFPDRGFTPAGRRVGVCPAQRVEGMTCDKCRLCSRADRPVIIGFRPHGAGKRAVEAIARG